MLINGAGGAVGTFAVQLAKAYGANVTGVDAGKLDTIRSTYVRLARGVNPCDYLRFATPSSGLRVETLSIACLDGLERGRVMRRIAVTLTAVAALLGLLAAPASAALQPPLRLHRQWTQWAFGSSTAPLLQEDLCGERVGDVFFLTVVAGSPTSITRRVDCTVQSGVPVLVTPGGVITWAPTDGTTDRQLQLSLFRFLPHLIVQSVRLVLDGREIDHGPLVVPDPYTIQLEPGNFLQTLDPAVTGDSTRVADGAYFRLLHLDPGDHTLVASAKYDFRHSGGDVVRYRSRFKIHVAT